MDSAEFSRRLRALRVEKRMTQRQVGAVLGRTGSCVCQWERAVVVPKDADDVLAALAASAARIRRGRRRRPDPVFADRLRELRVERRLSQACVAAGLGVTQACVCAWEMGSSRPLDADGVLARVAAMPPRWTTATGREPRVGEG